jgi:hypothetical protein
MLGPALLWRLQRQKEKRNEQERSPGGLRETALTFLFVGEDLDCAATTTTTTTTTTTDRASERLL